MRKFSVSIIALVIIICLLASCVSLQDKPITLQERLEFNTLGTVNSYFTTYRLLHFIGDDSIKSKAHDRLLAAAQKQYGNDVEIRNIQIKGGFSGWEFLGLVLATGLAIQLSDPSDPSYPAEGLMRAPLFATVLNVPGHFQKITASADVVRLGTAALISLTAQANYQRLEAALNRAAVTLIDEIPSNAIIAILNVSSNDQNMAAYALDELEFILIQARRFEIVDRRQLEQIRAEQNFQLSGDVSDDSAVSIGYMLGAAIVITGDISSFGQAMRLSLRVIDVRTARVLTIVREQF